MPLTTRIITDESGSSSRFSGTVKPPTEIQSKVSAGWWRRAPAGRASRRATDQAESPKEPRAMRQPMSMAPRVPSARSLKARPWPADRRASASSSRMASPKRASTVKPTRGSSRIRKGSWLSSGSSMP